MKILLITFLLVLSTSTIFLQKTSSQEGYLVVVDQTAVGDVYYVSPFLKYDFPTENDAIERTRNILDAQFKAYVLANYKLGDFLNIDNNWNESGGGMPLEKSYNDYIENLTITKKAIIIVRVEDFIITGNAE